MERSVILLSLGTILLFVIYELFAGGSIFFPLNAPSLYFSSIGFILLNASGIVAALAFFFSYKNEKGKKEIKKSKSVINPYLIIAFVIFFTLLGFRYTGPATIATMV